MSAYDNTDNDSSFDDVVTVDFSGTRPRARTLGRLAREFKEYGPPPLPRPTVGLVEGEELPLFYPGVNAIGGAPGTGKSLLLKFLTRQQVWADKQVLVMDCETSWSEYTSTMMVDLTMGSKDLDLVTYLADAQRNDPWQDRWSGLGSDKGKLEEVLAELDCSPSLAVIDSSSKSMGMQGLNEKDPAEWEKWLEDVAVPVMDRWPEAALVILQGRQKGWYQGQDQRQGRGTSQMLHEVKSQYMIGTKKKKHGSRTVDGYAEVQCTKDRYGHRAEESIAGIWRYGPSGFFLAQSEPEPDLPDEAQVRSEWLVYLDSSPRDPDMPSLPPKIAEAVEVMAGQLEVTSKKGRELVSGALQKLIRDPSINVRCRQLVQPGIPGKRPQRVWRGDASWAKQLGG